MNEQTGVARDLAEAVEEMQASLERAAVSAARIRELLPRVSTLSAVFDELQAVIDSGRQSAGIARQAASPEPARARPTLVVPSAAPPRQPQPWAAPAPQPLTPPEAWPQAEPAVEAVPDAPADQPFRPQAPGDGAEQLVAFRLEFEARPGPLDLRAVDDAVSEHPAVRDVALLDYDGRKATLKVWIDAAASPADVQGALTSRASEIFTGSDDVSIVAQEDVA